MADLESFLASRKISEADLAGQEESSPDHPIHEFISKDQVALAQKVS